MSGVKRGEHYADYLSYRSAEDIKMGKGMKYVKDVHCQF